ncbi:MAG TPA: NAD-binding protein, partial [Gammaproteobacteria bacterium]|nr:NAD-binding protein [Gammaproteobacteria bacterium]
MKIIILGAGQVGTTLAEHLATEHNDITIIDINGERLRSLQKRMDILTIAGNAAYPSTLKRGGAEDADMLIAVTNNDETNLVACQVAATLFQIPTKIARIRSLHYLAHEELFGAPAFPI